jgi:ribosomal protein S18 acetylase RimI-like enzyme
VTDVAARAIDVDLGQFALGNEVFERANATFVRNRDVPSIYDANHVRHIRARTPAEIDELLGAIDEEYAHAGHRRFDVDHRTPPEFVARLLLEGEYARDDALVMLLEGELQGKWPVACDIRPQVSDGDWDAYWELLFMDWQETGRRTGRKGMTEEIARRMWRSKRRRTPPVKYWLAYVGERPAAYFNSWEGIEGIGQVEDLFTHPDYRNRGIARALIHHCVRESRAAGAGPVVIVADPTDTPKHLYARMGFRPVAVVSHYLRKLEAA